MEGFLRNAGERFKVRRFDSPVQIAIIGQGLAEYGAGPPCHMVFTTGVATDLTGKYQDHISRIGCRQSVQSEGKSKKTSSLGSRRWRKI